jgi:hypothetical protein
MTMMRFPVLLTLLRMRYTLLWAQVRLRQGKIALFIVGYLLVVLIGTLLGVGGIGAALVAVQTGRAEIVARTVLGGFFLDMLAVSVLLGFGLSKIFAEGVLRRYPLTPLEQLTARQLLGVLEPLWLMAAALYCGVAVGFFALGFTVLWIAVPAALLLVVTNYLLARLLQMLIERLLASRGGVLAVLLFIWTCAVGGSMALPALLRNPAARETLLQVLAFTPPFAAAAIISGRGLLMQVPLLAAWAVGLAAVVWQLDRLPAPSRAIAGAEAAWGGPLDRIAALFPGVESALVAKSLRYYLRTNKVRFPALLTLPMLGFILFAASNTRGRRPPVDPHPAFLAAFFLSFIVTVIGTMHMDNNVFGYERSGFRRFLLAPVPPRSILQSLTVASVLVGSVQIPLAAAGWLLFSPNPGEWRMLVMLLANACIGLFLFRSIALWVSLLSPRRADYFQRIGNQLSVAGNLVAVGSVLIAFVLPQFLRQTVITPTLLAYWWASPLAVPVAYALLLWALRSGAGVFFARREQLLAVIEGRS